MASLTISNSRGGRPSAPLEELDGCGDRARRLAARVRRVARVHPLDPPARERRERRLYLAGLGPRVPGAVEEERRRADLGEATAVHIVPPAPSLVDDVEPGPAAGGEHLAPAFAVVAPASLDDRRAEPFRVAHGGLEELDGRALEREVVGRLEDERPHPLRREERQVSRDDRSVAVPPERRLADPERVH